jgi:protein disulfide-isomerase
MAFFIQGFPTVHFVNAKTVEGKVNFEGLGSTGYVAEDQQPWLTEANKF